MAGLRIRLWISKQQTRKNELIVPPGLKKLMCFILEED